MTSPTPIVDTIRARRDQIAEAHQRSPLGDWCDRCEDMGVRGANPWPCVYRQVVDDIDMLLAANTLLAGHPHRSGAQTMPIVAGRPFVCACGCIVGIELPDLYRCNACGTIYQEER